MTRVLVVDDSDTMRLIMRRALEADPSIKVVDAVENGRQAVAAAEKLRPDVITMDVLMPGMDGLEATRLIMEQTPTPIVMVSAVGDTEEQRVTFESFEAGAVWLVKKPKGSATADWGGWSKSLRDVVKSMAEVKVVSRRHKRPTAAPAPARAAAPVVTEFPRLIAIAASTGGPNALERVLSKVPPKYPIPILVCQHIAEGFISGLADWIGGLVKVPVRVASPTGQILCGVTIAPDGGHLELAGRDLYAVRFPAETDHYVPSADRLFASAAKYYGDEALGVILTGMGRDGALGMKELYDTGAVTIAQDEASSLIYGMPRAAVENGSVVHEMNLEEIADLLAGMAGAVELKKCEAKGGR